jgi:TolA-binding protein
VTAGESENPSRRSSRTPRRARGSRRDPRRIGRGGRYRRRLDRRLPAREIANNANVRSQDVEKDVADLQETIAELEQRVDHLEDAVETDLEEREYKQLSRKDKARAIQEELIKTAKNRPTKKAAMTYNEVFHLFNAKSSTGHVYDLMKLAAQEAGFDYEEPEDDPNRITT